jgi:urease accessory protein
MQRTGDLRSRLLAATVGAVAATLVTAAPAFAHPGHPATGLHDGFLHPLTGADHLLAMVAVGIVAATGHAARRAWVAPAAFLGGMVLGGLAGIGGLALPGAEHLIVASVVLLGLVVAGAVQERGRWVVPALVLAGIAHGYAHGAEAPTATHVGLYVAGFLAATTTLHVVGMGIGTVVRDRRLVRVGLGAATVAAGALLVL